MRKMQLFYKEIITIWRQKKEAYKYQYKIKEHVHLKTYYKF